MANTSTYKTFLLTFALALFSFVANAQYLLQAPNATDEHNYKWYNATDTATVLGTDFFLEVSEQGVYFATYDGTICGKNASGYFIVTNCNSPFNEVTLDVSDNIPAGATLTWAPTLTGDQTKPMVLATKTIQRYTATITKVGNSKNLPNFTVVCINEAAQLQDDVASTDEDKSVLIDIFSNDLDLPTSGTLSTTTPANGQVTIDNNGTPNNPLDDKVIYIPNPDYNGNDTFNYTLCNEFGDCSTATVNVTVIPIVDAISDSMVVTENKEIDIEILGNDNDYTATDIITYTNPTNGVITVNDGGTPDDSSDDTVTYTPNNNFTGTDTFTYTICDLNDNCSTATVTLIVTTADDIDGDNDGILDSFEDLNLDGDNNPATNPTDSDQDGIPDYLDIDSDNDGIPDNVEAQTTEGYIAPTGIDDNHNGVDDAYELNGNIGIFPIDTDGDSLPDYLDEDSDEDGVFDKIEAHDYNHDGKPDVIYLGIDTDGDGLDDGYEGSNLNDEDVNDEINAPNVDLPNTDSDDEVDYRDTDDDGDGEETKKEDKNSDGDFANDDINNNGIPDYLEPNVKEDELEVFNVITPNGDGVHDILKINGIEAYPDNSVHIYNRWGVLIFSTNGYNNTTNYFDGISQGRTTIDDTKPLPVGTYFYILKYTNETGKESTLNGYIYINR